MEQILNRARLNHSWLCFNTIAASGRAKNESKYLLEKGQKRKKKTLERSPVLWNRAGTPGIPHQGSVSALGHPGWSPALSPAEVTLTFPPPAPARAS